MVKQLLFFSSPRFESLHGHNTKFQKNPWSCRAEIAPFHQRQAYIRNYTPWIHFWSVNLRDCNAFDYGFQKQTQTNVPEKNREQIETKRTTVEQESPKLLNLVREKLRALLSNLKSWKKYAFRFSVWKKKIPGKRMFPEEKNSLLHANRLPLENIFTGLVLHQGSRILPNRCATNSYCTEPHQCWCTDAIIYFSSLL